MQTKIETEQQKRERIEKEQFSKRVNEMARVIMIDLMTTRAMTYDVSKVDYALKHADANLAALIDLIVRTRR